MEFQQARTNLLFRWKNGFARWIYTLEENETNDADTFIIHYTAVCLHFRLNRLFYA